LTGVSDATAPVAIWAPLETSQSAETATFWACDQGINLNFFFAAVKSLLKGDFQNRFNVFASFRSGSVTAGGSEAEEFVHHPHQVFKGVKPVSAGHRDFADSAVKVILATLLRVG